MAIVGNGKISLLSFLLGWGVFSVTILSHASHGFAHLVAGYWFGILFLYAAIANAIIVVSYQEQAYSVAVRGLHLGVVFGLALTLCISNSSLRLFGWYLAALSFFHWSEYFTTALTNPRNLGLESYLLDHSREYHIAAATSCVEFFIEWALFPGLKQPSWLSFIGLLLVIGGEVLRKLAMLTASSNFNHYVRHVREEGHVLVTHGVYAYSRHPSYVGWFYWSVGTQVVLCNPICAVGYSLVSWKFFKNRIMDEEITLLNFFGEQYLDYQRRVGTGLPFISGYRMEL